MSWIEWLKEFAERGSRGESPPQVRLSHTRSNTYSREWMKVLEGSSRNFDPADTYVWELGRNSAPVTQKPVPVDEMPASGKPSPGTVADDPWGLKADRPARRSPKEQGFNPYDTGIFNPDWTGDFDKR